MFTSKKIFISTEIRLSRRALRPLGLFFKIQLLEFNRQNKLYSVYLYKLFTCKKLSISTEIDSSGERLGLWAYFLKSIDRTQYTEQLLFYMS